MEYGILSLIPPAVAIVLAILTKQTVVSLFLGVWVGATIINGWNPFIGFAKSVSDFIIPSMADEWNAGLLLFVALIGGFLGVIEASGATKGLEQYALKNIKSRKKALTITWASSFAFLYTEPSTILGFIVRPITDKFKIPRVKLAYVLDSMGCTVATNSPISPHGPFVVGVIAIQFAELGISDSAWSMFFKMIPYNLYAIFAILTALFVIRKNLNIGPMYKAEAWALNTGEVIGPNDKPMVEEKSDNSFEGKDIPVRNFTIPLLCMIITIFIVIFWSGDIVSNGFGGAFANANVMLAITLGVFVSTATAGLVGVFSKLLNFETAINRWLQGVSQLMMVLVILVLAWSIGSITGAMGLQDYLITFVQKFGLVKIVPALMFLIGGLISFATGSSWGVFAIMMPIAIPVAYSTGIHLPLAIGAAVSGGLFGDHCSPISDTTILSSTGAACDHVEHVKTQMPYAITIAIAVFIGYLIAGITGIPILSIFVTIAVLSIELYFLTKYTKNKYDVLIDNEVTN